jgi:hypothetical protein
MKQTAVEWLENKFKEELILINSANGYHIFVRVEKFDKLVQQAKAIEKEHICKTYIMDIFGIIDVEKLCKQEAEKLHDKSKHEDWDIYNCLVYEDAEMIKIGFNKAMDLMKDQNLTQKDVLY